MQLLKVRKHFNVPTRTSFVVAFLVLVAVAGLAYSQICRSCASIEPVSEHEPEFVREQVLAQQPIGTTVVDPAVEWNQNAVTFTLSASPALAPVQQIRVMAIAQTAVHDAVSGITRKYATYLPRRSPPENASPEAAAIAAAHRSLRAIFTTPSEIASLDNLYQNSLAAHEISPSDPGLDYGRAVADALLAIRANDGSAQAQFNYIPAGAGQPGVWVPIGTQQSLLPGWGGVAPFVLRSGSQFRPEAPPALDSETYTRDYNEIKEIGSANSTTRTALQSQIALFWRASPTAIWNPVLRQALATRDLDLSTTARTLALFYLAASDASVACWDAKYVHNFWRPQAAIRNGDLDGNDLTTADPTWTPFVSTPAHPDYASGHATNSSTMAAVLESVFGEGLDGPIVVTLSGITRQWDTFDEAVREVIDARVYSGIHFRNSDVVGARQGRQVAQFVINHALRPCKNEMSRCF